VKKKDVLAILAYIYIIRLKC